eukprot:NODE_528_length_6433_cov_0.887907.p5 type:complete len:294 gc:universal NODE_528_length_6433_cov_0.887907:4550-5431(+)
MVNQTIEIASNQSETIRSLNLRTNHTISESPFGTLFRSTIYLANSIYNNQIFAVKKFKIVSPEPQRSQIIQTCENEINIWANLQHPNLVRYFESDWVNEYILVAMEYVSGYEGQISLKDLLRNRANIQETLIQDITKQILSALSYLHERDVHLLNLNASHVLLNGNQVKLIGFSYKKIGYLQENIFHSVQLFRSEYNLAPEVAQYAIFTSKADIWSLGCIIIQMLKGESRRTSEILLGSRFYNFNEHDYTPKYPDKLYPEIKSLLDKCLVVNYEQRSPASELLEHSYLQRQDR